MPGIKEDNYRVILNQIRRFGPISRTEIADNTKISKSTVSRFVDQMIMRGMVIEIGTTKLPGAGRRPVVVDLNMQAFYSIGVNIEDDLISAAIFDASLNMIESIVAPLAGATGEKALLILVDTIEQLINESDVVKNRITGIGIGVSGTVEFHAGETLRFDANNFITGINTKLYLEERLGISVLVDNIANVQALKERWSGYAGLSTDFLHVICSNNINSAAIINGNVVRGWKNLTSSLGHMVINTEGRKCVCGKNGCIEMYSSEKALNNAIGKILENKNIEGRVSEQAARKDTEQADERASERNTKQDSERAAEKATEQGTCRLAAEEHEIIEQAAKSLAVGISNLIGVYNPEMVILSGTVFEKYPEMYNAVVSRVWKQIFGTYAGDIIFHKRNIESYIYETCAASMALNNYFNTIM